MNAVKMVSNFLNRLLVGVSLIALLVMILIIIFQVFSRQLFHYTPSWSEELSIILFVWTSFLGIAYGFKARLHIGVSFLVNLFPSKVQDAMDFLAKILILFFGIVLVYYGTKFTILMGNSTLAGTGLETSYLYAAIPVTGVFVLFYGIELLFSKGLHQEYNDEIDVDAMNAAEKEALK